MAKKKVSNNQFLNRILTSVNFSAFIFLYLQSKFWYNLNYVQRMIREKKKITKRSIIVCQAMKVFIKDKIMSIINLVGKVLQYAFKNSLTDADYF